jgi:hypothetical protein
MFDFTEAILINAPHDAVWQVLRNIDGWWLASNADHDSLEHLDMLPVTQVGVRIRIREKIGGIPGEAVGSITSVEPGSAPFESADECLTATVESADVCCLKAMCLAA